MKPLFYIVGTPIGNMEDISRRAIETLRSVDVILAEDTRHTRKLLSRHDIRNRLISCHSFNEQARVQELIERTGRGESVALVTNAGMPCISDPGAKLVAACQKQGIPFSVIPGPSSVTAAMAASGFGGGRFHFEGFLPRGAGARKKRLTLLADLPYPSVFFVSPYRCVQLLCEFEEIFGDRAVFLAREITKLNEQFIAGSAATVRRALENAGQRQPAPSVKGEIVVVLSPAPKAGRGRGDERAECSEDGI